MFDRRTVLRILGAGLAAAAGRPRLSAHEPDEGSIMTVLGRVSPGRLGSTLSHEHVLVDFVGADRITPERYDADSVFDAVLPHLVRAKALGCRGFVECTPAYLGRDPRLLVRLSRASGLHVLTNTGYYGAARDQYVPAHARAAGADMLADRWTAEWRDGIDGTGVRPGFIKTGVDAGPLSDLDRTLVRAAARTHARTGLTIASHTGDTRAAQQQFEVLAEEGVQPDAFIWVHAQNDWDVESRVAAAARGAWIEIDNVGSETIAVSVERASALRARGALRRLLVSHDAGWYRPGEPGGGRFTPFEAVYASFVPALRQAGWPGADIDRLLVANPADAFTVRVRAHRPGPGPTA